jgi:hypothetical protein
MRIHGSYLFIVFSVVLFGFSNSYGVMASDHPMCKVSPATLDFPVQSPGHPAKSDISSSVDYKSWFLATAGAFSLMGVVLGHMLSQFQFGRRLEHEAKLNLRATQTGFQKEIYLKAAEVIADATSSIMRAVDKNGPDLSAEFARVKLGPMLNQVHLIASNSTINALNAFLDKYSAAIMDIYIAAAADDKNRAYEKQLGEKVEAGLEKERALVRQLSLISPEGRVSQEFITVLETYNLVQKELEDLIFERNKVSIALSETSLSRVKDATDAQFELTEKLVEANIAIRRELEFRLDENLYRQTIQTSNASSKKRLYEFIDRLKNVSGKNRG